VAPNRHRAPLAGNRMLLSAESGPNWGWSVDTTRGLRSHLPHRLPLMHGTGLFMALAALLGGGTVVTLTGATFDADELCHAVATNRVTSVVLVGDAFARPILRSLNAAAEAHDISSIRSIVSSGAMWSHEVKAGLLEHNRAMILVDSFELLRSAA